MDSLSIWNFDIGVSVREELLDGRTYKVVPMVMILEGVHTGSQGPVYYSVEELAKTPKQWNMKPIVVEHPFRGDTATELEVYKKQAVGMIMNTHFIDGKLKAEAWIDIDKAREICPTLLDHIDHRLPMEVSTGLFSELVMEGGTWHGEEYKGKIINIRADHLAILPSKQGACSLSDGAGLLINQNCAEEFAKEEVKRNDVFNVISTVINQEYPPGSSIVGDYDLDLDIGKKKEQEEKVTEHEKKEEDKETKSEKKDGKHKIENAIRPEIFMTADGNKITYEAADNGTLEIEQPDFASGTKDELDLDKMSEEGGEKQEVTPIQDNAIKVDTKQKLGRKEFIDMLENLAYHIEQYQNCAKRNSRLLRNKRTAHTPLIVNARLKSGRNVKAKLVRVSNKFDAVSKLGKQYGASLDGSPDVVRAKMDMELCLDEVLEYERAIKDLVAKLLSCAGAIFNKTFQCPEEVVDVLKDEVQNAEASKEKGKTQENTSDSPRIAEYWLDYLKAIVKQIKSANEYKLKALDEFRALQEQNTGKPQNSYGKTTKRYFREQYVGINKELDKIDKAANTEIGAAKEDKLRENCINKFANMVKQGEWGYLDYVTLVYEYRGALQRNKTEGDAKKQIENAIRQGDLNFLSVLCDVVDALCDVYARKISTIKDNGKRQYMQKCLRLCDSLADTLLRVKRGCHFFWYDPEDGKCVSLTKAERQENKEQYLKTYASDDACAGLCDAAKELFEVFDIASYLSKCRVYLSGKEAEKRRTQFNTLVRAYKLQKLFPTLLLDDVPELCDELESWSKRLAAVWKDRPEVRAEEVTGDDIRQIQREESENDFNEV